jgi:hypothetical protein
VQTLLCTRWCGASVRARRQTRSDREGGARHRGIECSVGGLHVGRGRCEVQGRQPVGGLLVLARALRVNSIGWCGCLLPPRRRRARRRWLGRRGGGGGGAAQDVCGRQGPGWRPRVGGRRARAHGAVQRRRARGRATLGGRRAAGRAGRRAAAALRSPGPVRGPARGGPRRSRRRRAWKLLRPCRRHATRRPRPSFPAARGRRCQACPGSGVAGRGGACPLHVPGAPLPTAGAHRRAATGRRRPRARCCRRRPRRRWRAARFAARCPRTPLRPRPPSRTASRRAPGAGCRARAAPSNPPRTRSLAA